MKHNIELSTVEAMTVIRALQQFAGDYGHNETDRISANEMAFLIERQVNEEIRHKREEAATWALKST